MTKLLKSICGSNDKPLILAGLEIPCYVLENEKRVITQSGLLKALGMSTGGASKAGSRKIDEFLENSAIKPFIDEETQERANNVIHFKPQGKGGSAFGYEATILVDICEAVLKSERKGKLHKSQQHIAERAAVLYSAFAKIGIIALVDEATGYQDIRDRNALYKILEA